MLSLDTETFLIGPGAIAPRVVCASTYTPSESDVVGNGDNLEDYLHAVFEYEDKIITHRGAYDLACIVGTFPNLMVPVVKALEEGRIHCTLIREKLLNLASHGQIEFGPTGKPVSYALASLAYNRVGIDMRESKVGDDIWRLRYHELDGMSASDYPPEAYEYARMDAQATYEVFKDQERDTFSHALACESLHVKADFCLYLKTVRGIEVDPAEKRKVQEEVDRHLDPTNLPLIYEAGLVLPAQGAMPYSNGTKAHSPGCPKKNCSCPVKLKAPTPEKVAKKAALVPLVEAISLAQGIDIKYTDKGNIATDSEFLSLLAPYSPALAQFVERAEWIKLRTSYFPALEWPFGSGVTAQTVHPNYDPLKKTGRVSAKGNNKRNAARALYPAVAIQQADPRVRGVFKPRDGFVFVVVDYSAMELCSLAQTIYDLYGYSTHRDQINAGIDPHSFLGTVLAFEGDPEFAASVSDVRGDDSRVYERFLARKESDPDWFKHWRTFAKPVGLGYPGGMGLDTMVSVCAGYGFTIDRPKARSLKRTWFKVYPEMRLYLEQWVNQSNGRYVSPRGMIRSGCSYTECANGNALQTPGAEGMKEAMWLVTKECYAGSLIGCYPLINMHDELVVEVPEGPTMFDQAKKIGELMVQGMSKVLPDVTIKADPEVVRRWTKTAVPLEPSSLQSS